MKIYQAEPGVVLEKDAKTAAMFEWAASVGVKINEKLAYPVLFNPGYLGVQALEAIEPCEDLLWAPNSSMLTSKLMNPPELLEIYKNHPGLFSIPDKSHEDNRMLVYMIFEQSKGTSSTWHVYFNFLPKDVETIIDWTDQELSELQDADFEYDSKYRRERDFKGNTELADTLKSYPQLFNEELLNVHNLNWLWKILCTRSYGRCIPHTGLIPIADLFNHNNVNTNYFYGTFEEKCPDSSSEKLVVDYEDTDDPLVESKKPLIMACMKLLRLSIPGFKTLPLNHAEKYSEILQQARVEDSQSFVKKMDYATMQASLGSIEEEPNSMFRVSCSKFERIEAGAQVFISYGRYSNRQLLTNYGFVLNENRYNYARITIPLGKFLNQVQAEGLTGGYSLEMPTLFKLKLHEFASDLLKVIRGFNWRVEIHSPNAFFRPYDYDLELVSIDKMIELLSNILETYPTTIEEDEHLLKNATGKLSIAITYRLSNKNIIKRQILFGETIKNIIIGIKEGKTVEEQKAELESPETLFEGIRAYLQDLQEFR